MKKPDGHKPTTPTPAEETPEPTPTRSATAAIDKVSPAVVCVIAEGMDFFMMESGMIVDKAGHVLTNNHVVEGAQTVIVVLANGWRFPASILDRDDVKDLAILKISGDRLPVVTLGRSSELKAGDEVIAIGFPLAMWGDSASASTGIVSAFRDDSFRIRSGGAIYMQTDAPIFRDGSKAGVTYIQIDAAINSGNSGGPLINLEGEVVGINAGSAQTLDQYIRKVPIEGTSLAIAIDSAKPIIPRLIAGESTLESIPPSVSHWKTYTNETCGYSIEYPGDWEADDSNKESVYIDLPYARCIFVNVNDPLATWPLSLSDYVNWQIGHMRDDLDRFSLISSRSVRHQGREAWELIYLGEFRESVTGVYKIKELIVPTSTHLYRVNIAVVSGYYEAFSAETDRILASFRLTY